MNRRGYIPTNNANLDALMAQLEAAIRNGDSAEAAMLQAQIDSLKDEVSTAQKTADTAQATGQNARSMVLTRDPRLTEVEQNTSDLARLAADYSDKVAASVADRQQLHQDVADLHDRIENISLTPGPPGKDGKPGTDGSNGRDGINGQDGRNGNDGAPGTPGTPGLNGRDSTVAGPEGKSAYEVARDNGYGGTKTQWLATLRGEPGSKGDAGTPADMARVAALETKVAALEAARVFAVGITNTPALSLLATTDVTIELSREMPNTDYTIDLSRSQSLLTVGAVTYKSRTKTTITYTIRAVVALGAGSLVALARY